LKILLHNTDRGLVPVYGSDYDQKKKLKIGEEYLAEIRKPRNIKFHKKFFALIELCFQNQEVYNNREHMRKQLTMSAGYYDTFVNHKGNTCYEPKSVAFSKMDEAEFSEFYERFCDTVSEFIGVTNKDIQIQIHDFF